MSASDGLARSRARRASSCLHATVGSAGAAFGWLLRSAGRSGGRAARIWPAAGPNSEASRFARPEARAAVPTRPRAWPAPAPIGSGRRTAGTFTQPRRPAGAAARRTACSRTGSPHRPKRRRAAAQALHCPDRDFVGGRRPALAAPAGRGFRNLGGRAVVCWLAFRSCRSTPASCSVPAQSESRTHHGRSCLAPRSRATSCCRPCCNCFSCASISMR